MAITNKGDLQRRPLGDAAVEANMPNGLADDPIYSKVQRARSRTTAQRKQAKRDARRNKATYDLPEWITDRVREIAEEQGCPPAHVAGALLAAGLDALDNGDLDLQAQRVASNHPRYLWFLEINS